MNDSLELIIMVITTGDLKIPPHNKTPLSLSENFGKYPPCNFRAKLEKIGVFWVFLGI